MSAWRIAVSMACLAAVSGQLLAADSPNSPQHTPARQSKSKAADEAAAALVQQALRAEAAGNAAERDRAIDAALAAAPDFAPARWHKGQVRFEGKWVPFAAAQQLAARDPRFAEYRKMREELGGTIQGQIALAGWCAKHKLIDEEQIHWRAVLALDPDNREAARHLGLVQVDGAWVKPAQGMILKKHGKQLKDAREHWMPICDRLQHDLDHGNDKARQQAAARLREINDPAAIRSLVNVLSIAGRLHGREMPSVATNLLLVEVLGQMPQQESTNALIYEVLENFHDEVALAAADELRHRSMQSYVPMLLSRMESPLQAKYQIHTEPNGTIIYQHWYFREEAQADELFRKELWYRPSYPILFPTNNPLIVGPYEAALDEVTLAAQQNQAQVELRIAGAEQLKKRIRAVLERTTGQQLGDEPSAWWRYWLDYNELFVPQDPAFEQYSSRSVRIYPIPRWASYPTGLTAVRGGK